jgi:hypothetical protein
LLDGQSIAVPLDRNLSHYLVSCRVDSVQAEDALRYPDRPFADGQAARGIPRNADHGDDLIRCRVDADHRSTPGRNPNASFAGRHIDGEEGGVAWSHL